MKRLYCDGLYASLEDFSRKIKEKRENDEEIRKLYSGCNKQFLENGKLEDSLEKRYVSNSDNTEDMVKYVIENGNYDERLKESVAILLDKIGADNLYLCSMNLAFDPEIIKVDETVLDKNATGKYDNKVNAIMYTDDKSINHELMHLASSPFAFNQEEFRQSGFQIVFDGLPFGTGLNEGYTELLNRRYFENDYNNGCYTTNVYLIRLFELLYDNPKDMEKDYFNANYTGPLNVFSKYGSNEELEFLMNYLDFKATGVEEVNQEMLMMEFMSDIVSRTGDLEKSVLAEEIIDEYIYVKNEMNNEKTR